jgi:hypothetical protein
MLERVSRVIEATPDLTAREVRARARMPRKTCEEALELLRRGKFVTRQARTTEDTYRSALPYRSAAFARSAGFENTHSVSQGGGG